MPFIPVPNTAEAVLRYVQDGQKLANVFHAEWPAPPSIVELSDLALDLRDWWIANMRPIVGNNVTLEQVAAKSLHSAGAPAVEFPVPAGTGADPAPALPNCCTVTVKWLTGLAGRSFRGRSYHVGLTEAQVTNNNIIPASLSVIAAAYNLLIPALTQATRTMVVVSKYSGVDALGRPIPRSAGVTTQITESFMDAVVDTQRRRLPGRGR